MERPSIEQLNEWLAYWQPVLGLTHWQILVSWNTAKRMDNPGHAAEAWFNYPCHTAELRFNQEVELEEPECSRPHTWEDTLVHELLHCVIDPATPQKAMGQYHNRMYERAINQISGALICMRYGDNDKTELAQAILRVHRESQDEAHGTQGTQHASRESGRLTIRPSRFGGKHAQGMQDRFRR